MAVVTNVPQPNFWKEICKEYEQQNSPFCDEVESIKTDLEDYDPAKHNPVFYGMMHTKFDVMDDDIIKDVDTSIVHPAAIGHAFINRPAPSPPQSPLPPPDHKTCSPRTYLENYIFPTLMPAIENMLITAKKERCFERKITRFNALDYVTEHLYYNNPQAKDGRSKDGSLSSIDFVNDHLKKYPRPPLPLSLLWTEEEATLVIQSWWRGYVVRRDPEVQELRQWQKMWREEQADVNAKVSNFWANKIPDEVEETNQSGNDQTEDETKCCSSQLV